MGRTRCSNSWTRRLSRAEPGLCTARADAAMGRGPPLAARSPLLNPAYRAGDDLWRVDPTRPPRAVVSSTRSGEDAASPRRGDHEWHERRRLALDCDRAPKGGPRGARLDPGECAGPCGAAIPDARIGPQAPSPRSLQGVSEGAPSPAGWSAAYSPTRRRRRDLRMVLPQIRTLLSAPGAETVRPRCSGACPARGPGVPLLGTSRALATASVRSCRRVRPYAPELTAADRRRFGGSSGRLLRRQRRVRAAASSAATLSSPGFRLPKSFRFDLRSGRRAERGRAGQLPCRRLQSVVDTGSR